MQIVSTSEQEARQEQLPEVPLYWWCKVGIEEKKVGRDKRGRGGKEEKNARGRWLRANLEVKA